MNDPNAADTFFAGLIKFAGCAAILIFVTGLLIGCAAGWAMK